MRFFLGAKYDIAISVAEEDIAVAQQIVVSLAAKKIRYYLYTEHEHWGRHIFEILLDVFGKDSRYVLMITSNIFKDQYWANIEKMIAIQYSAKRGPSVLQLKLDDTEIDGVDKYVIYKNWDNNAEEISDIIKSILKRSWYRRFINNLVKCLLLFLSIGFVGIIIYQAKTRITYRENNAKFEPIKDKECSDSIDLDKKISIPEAVFQMGYKTSKSIEAPLHTVKIYAFNISPTEVTIDQYFEYCKNKKMPLPPQPYNRNSGRYPISNISWFEALAYCKWRNGRLPTEAEWEYAAAAGLMDRYSGSNNAQKVGVYNRVKPNCVATKLPNGFGLYDMTGNVSEWCSDYFDSSYYYLTGKIIDPHGPMTGTERVVRGGAYDGTISPKNTLHVSFRSKEFPDQRKPYIGFRVVWDK